MHIVIINVYYNAELIYAQILTASVNNEAYANRTILYTGLIVLGVNGNSYRPLHSSHYGKKNQDCFSVREYDLFLWNSNYDCALINQTIRQPLVS